jgi:transposase InsO family protein
MRVMPDRCLQLDCQRRAPELATIAPTSGQSELRVSRRSAHFGDRCPTRVGVFFRTPRLAPLTSDAPSPLPRRRVNDTGFNVGQKHLPSLAARARQSRRQPQPTTFPPNE